MNNKIDLSKFVEESKKIFEETIAKMPYKEIREIKDRYYKNKSKKPNQGIYHWFIIYSGV